MTRHHSQRAARRLVDMQLLALQPNQQLVYEDTFSFPLKTFETQLPANLIQHHGIDGQQFTTSFNQLNSTLLEFSKKEAKQSWYMMLIVGSIFLSILTFGLGLVCFLPVMVVLVIMHFISRQKLGVLFSQEIQPKMNQAVQSLNNAQLKANGFEWVLIRIHTGTVLRLVYSAPLQQVGIHQPQQQFGVLPQVVYQQQPIMNQQNVQPAMNELITINDASQQV